MSERADGRRLGAPGRWRRAWWAAAVAALVALTVGAAGCGGEPGEDLPEDVLGTWSAARAPYTDRAFRISRDSIYFETMDGFFEGYPIEDVDISTHEGRLLFTVVYRSPSDREYDFSFYYATPGGGEIRFKNRQAVPWDKTADADSATTGQGGEPAAGRTGRPPGEETGSAGS